MEIHAEDGTCNNETTVVSDRIMASGTPEDLETSKPAENSLHDSDVPSLDILRADDYASTPSLRSSKSSSPDPDLSEIKPLNISDSTYNNIMSACSTAAQHIRQTITEVLNSRLESNSSSVVIEEVTDSFEESLKQKIEDFENTVKNNMPSSSAQDSQNSEEKSASLLEKAECSAQPLSEPDSTDVSAAGSDESSETGAVKKTLENEDLKKVTDKVDDDESEPKLAEKSIENLESHHQPEDTKHSAESSSVKRPADKKECISNTSSKPALSNDLPTDGIAANKPLVTDFHTTIDEKALRKSNKNTGNKKKGEKSVDQILKSLTHLQSSDEKLQALCRKHSEILEELKCAELRLKQSERQVIQLSKEKEQLQAEHNRMILAKSKLESLCRELQRQNKAIKEESLLRIREEEEKRKEVASKFQTTLNEISNLMQENSKKNLQLKEENTELAQKLKTLVEHYEMWEKHMEKVVQQKDLEAQLAKAKHAKTNLQMKQETEKFLKEKQSLLENMSELQKKCTQLASNELQLRAELNDYTSKYEEFQSVLNKSNQVFASFKSDMETTSKKIKKLEKETNVWKQKWESSNNALLEMITDKQKRDKELLNAQQRVLTLEKLCRALQAERNDLQNQLSGNHTPDDCSIPSEEKQPC